MGYGRCAPGFPMDRNVDSPINNDYDGTWSHPAAKRRRMDPNAGPNTQERGVMRDSNGPGSPHFIGSGSGIHLIRIVYDVLARSHTDQTRNGHDVAATDAVPGEEDQLTRASPSDSRTHFWKPDEMAGRMASINFNSLLQWTENYFRNWHPIFPLLYGPAFLGVLEQVGQNGLGALHQADAIMVRSILSISLADSRQIGGRRHPFPPSLVFLDQDDISASLAFLLSTPASIKNIQAALCVELFLLSMLNFNMASKVGGIIIRMSFNLGLHRCPSRFPNFSPHDVLMRKRLWWSIYCLDRAVCQTLGLPLGIKDDDIDVCLPSEELHGPGKDSQSNGTGARGQCEYEQLQLLIMLSKHAKLRGMILELRNKSIRYRHGDSERALRVQAELKRWANEVYDLTRAHSPSRNSPFELQSELQSEHSSGSPHASDGGIPLPHRILLITLQHELILSLHRPLLASNPGTPSSQAAFEECINASRAIIDTAADNSRNVGKEEVNLKNGHLVWFSLTWSIWMSCFVLTYAAIEGITTAVSARRYANRALQVLKLLSLRKTSWPEKCCLAVEQLIAFLGHGGCNDEGRSLLITRRDSPRRRGQGQPKHYPRPSEVPDTTGPAPNPENPQEGGGWPLPCQAPRFDDQGSAHRQFQSVHSASGTNFSGTMDGHDLPMPDFTEFAPNATFGYANQPDSADHIIYADPLIALDFANFAQGSNTQGMMDMNLGFDGFD